MKAKVDGYVGIIVEMIRITYLTDKDGRLEAVYSITICDEYNIQHRLFNIPAHKIEVLGGCIISRE